MRSGGGAISMSMATPADAIVGAVTALAAMHKPSNNALREAFIQHSFFMSFSYQETKLTA
jgi:hypothetical protein